MNTNCTKCKENYELELIDYSFWDKRHKPSSYECPNCSNKYYIREPQWINSLTWKGTKIKKLLSHNEIKTSSNYFNVDLDSTKVYQILKEKGIANLHHANTVGSSKTFLEKKALLSREYVKRENLYQTPQDSDEKDINYGINDYLFLDAKDLADYFGKPNEYGPVLFKFNLDLLLDPEIPTIRISRNNPCYWKVGDAINERYYNDLEDFKTEYLTGNKLRDGRTMFMLTTKQGKLSLTEYLISVSVDNPNLWVFFEGKGKVKYIEKIKEFLGDEIEALGVHREVLNRFAFAYNIMYTVKYSKFQKFFTVAKIE